MLKKKYRFHSRGGVRYVYQKGKTIRTPKLSLVFTRNFRGFTRFGVVVSKKVEKSAVKRNRIRRRVYEALRVNFDLIPKNKDYLFVVFSKDVEKMPFSELEKILGELVEESKVKADEEKFYDIIRRR
ncbi:ribonuclease P protein component [Candidatus Saccharibacteria bacterium]|nr:ribonuclease P protein component [Candidatus Saccharibacteria bacterium]